VELILHRTKKIKVKVSTSESYIRNMKKSKTSSAKEKADSILANSIFSNLKKSSAVT
jgi:hypothetical protein